jgi:hypothetical protein
MDGGLRNETAPCIARNYRDIAELVIAPTRFKSALHSYKTNFRKNFGPQSYPTARRISSALRADKFKFAVGQVGAPTKTTHEVFAWRRPLPG